MNDALQHSHNFFFLMENIRRSMKVVRTSASFWTIGTQGLVFDFLPTIYLGFVCVWWVCSGGLVLLGKIPRDILLIKIKIKKEAKNRAKNLLSWASFSNTKFLLTESVKTMKLFYKLPMQMWLCWPTVSRSSDCNLGFIIHGAHAVCIMSHIPICQG